MTYAHRLHRHGQTTDLEYVQTMAIFPLMSCSGWEAQMQNCDAPGSKSYKGMKWRDIGTYFKVKQHIWWPIIFPPHVNIKCNCDQLCAPGCAEVWSSTLMVHYYLGAAESDCAVTKSWSEVKGTDFLLLFKERIIQTEWWVHTGGFTKHVHSDFIIREAALSLLNDSIQAVILLQKLSWHI